MKTSEQPNLRLVFGGLLLVMLLAALDQTIVATALPTIVGDLGGLDHISWVVTAYLLAQTAVTPLYGKLGDMYGRKVVLQAGLVVFLAGSALCGLSKSLDELIAFRALQGLGGGGDRRRGAAPRAGQIHGPVRRGVRAGEHRGTAARRLPDERSELALDLLREPATRGARVLRARGDAALGQRTRAPRGRLPGHGAARGRAERDRAGDIARRQLLRVGLIVHHRPGRRGRAGAGRVRLRRAPRARAGAAAGAAEEPRLLGYKRRWLHRRL